MRKRQQGRQKPGPEPKTLNIESDPEEALRKLLTTPPPERQDEPEGADEDEESRGD